MNAPAANPVPAPDADGAAKDRLIFFSTDRGYLLPTLVAAAQAIGQREVAALCDAVVYLIGLEDGEVEAIRSSFATPGLSFETLGVELGGLLDPSAFADTHVSPTTLARLALAPAIPSRYRHVVHLDGDILIVGDLLPLVRHDVAPGRLLAAIDSTVATSRASGAFARDVRGYLDGLGVRDRSAYFNAGILASRRETWQAIAGEALAFIAANGPRCRYHDQSALNAVCRDRREVLHPAFNYGPSYRATGSRLFEPAIIHFVGPAKPWMDGSPLWDGRFRPIYEGFVAEHPWVAPYWRREARVSSYRDLGDARGWRARLGRYAKRRRLEDYVRRTTFAVAPARA